jgi:hypothetical protein
VTVRKKTEQGRAGEGSGCAEACSGGQMAPPGIGSSSFSWSKGFGSPMEVFWEIMPDHKWLAMLIFRI